MDSNTFEKLVEKAYESIPEKWRARMSNVAVCVADRDAEDPELLGVYEGVALTERGIDISGMLPDRIVLFRLTILEEAAGAGSDVYQVVRETLIHEVAHHFGWDDAQIEVIFETHWDDKKERP